MKKKILIAGQTGMVGSSIYRLIKKKKLYKIIECKRKDLDFTSQSSVDQWFKKNKPEIVINAAGKVGGILDNSTYQSDYLYINTMIGLNLINSSLKYNVKKFINLGSACIYPKNVKQPITEDSLLSSQLEKSNEGYAIAKIACLKYCQYLKKKKKKNFKSVEVWGSGKARREFLNVNDLANAILFLLTKKIKEDYINIGSGEQVSIKQLALSIKQTVDYKGKVIFNKKYPDGVMRRQINSQSIKKLGWQANIKLKQGLIEYCNYYIKKVMPLENENL